VVREVYRIDRWHPAGTLQYETRDDAPEYPDRWEFEGKVAQEFSDRYVDRSVGKGGQLGFRYVNAWTERRPRRVTLKPSLGRCREAGGDLEAAHPSWIASRL
jgi:hypothetical protein